MKSGDNYLDMHRVRAISVFNGVALQVGLMDSSIPAGAGANPESHPMLLVFIIGAR